MHGHAAGGYLYHAVAGRRGSAVAQRKGTSVLLDQRIVKTRVGLDKIRYQHRMIHRAEKARQIGTDALSRFGIKPIGREHLV